MGKQKRGGGGGGGGGNRKKKNTRNRNNRRESQAGSSIGSSKQNSIPEEVHVSAGADDNSSVAGSSVEHSTSPQPSKPASAPNVLEPSSTPIRDNLQNKITLENAADIEAELLTYLGQTIGSSPSSPEELPQGLKDIIHEFSREQQELAIKLCSPEAAQRHLFENWKGKDDLHKKKELMEQLQTMDATYPNGGLQRYLKNARNLLDKSRKGENPLDGWTPSVPKGQNFQIGTAEYESTERIGLKEVGKCGFVLVAGGLGERLGYNDIKIGLPTELSTETCYIDFYIKTILAFQNNYSQNGSPLPLCIMTSGSTNEKTLRLLEANNYFGMPKSQVTIVQQGLGVPALENNNAKIAIDHQGHGYKIQAKPHGHGDIHALIYSEGVAKKWLQHGIKWAVFFQDTNGLAFHTLPLALGLSAKMNLIMNSLAVPRKAKQAIGGIVQLTNTKTNEQRTINVEYNQLDPLLQSSETFPDGDQNDPNTGYSPFPGNINQLVFKLEPYSNALDRTQGAMPEFVNPKYKDLSKTEFKAPTRLECMMQDFPTILEGDEAKRVGFTCIDSSVCFSAVKNATTDGVALQKSGIAPGVAATGEQDQYQAQAIIMRSVGCQVEQSTSALTFKQIRVFLTPAIVLKPNFVSCPAEYKIKFPYPSQIKISARSSLVVEGSAVVIESLTLDGALVIKSEAGVSDARIVGLEVKNKGWVNVSDSNPKSSEVIKMRGFRLSKLETRTIVFKADGTIEGDYSIPKVQEPVQEIPVEMVPPDTKVELVNKQDPAPDIKVKPVPFIEDDQVSGTTVEPVPAIYEDPTPSITVAEVPVIIDEPVPDTKEETVTVESEDQVPDTTVEPVSAIYEDPTLSTTVAEVPVINDEPVINNEPVPDTMEEPVTVESEDQVPDTTVEPVPAIYEDPILAEVPVINDEPVPDTKEETVTVESEDQVPDTTIETVSAIYEDPTLSTTVAEVPVINHEPVPDTKVAPVLPKKEQAAKTEFPAPDSKLEPVPVINEDPALATTIESATNVEPVPVIDKNPVTAAETEGEQSPVTKVETTAATKVESAPVTMAEPVAACALRAKENLTNDIEEETIFRVATVTGNGKEAEKSLPSDLTSPSEPESEDKCAACACNIM